MNGLTAFLLGAVCGGLGFAAYDWIGWLVGITGAISIIIVEWALDGDSK